MKSEKDAEKGGPHTPVCLFRVLEWRSFSTLVHYSLALEEFNEVEGLFALSDTDLEW